MDPGAIFRALAESRVEYALVGGLAATARKAGHLPLGTFDRELGKLDGAQRL